MGGEVDSRIAIVGAGQAAAQAVETLRKRGHKGPITLIGDESLLPYQRPPLSKKFLAGTLERDRLLIRHAAHYADHAVQMRLGFAAVRIDRERRRVEIADGSAVEYDRLLLATGSHPRRLMGYLGLIPSEDSSGEHRHQGVITKAGNSSARRALVEAAWAYQFSAKVSALIARRQAEVPKAALDIAWKAQVRLCARFRRLAARKVNRNKIVVAIARELAGFVWAIARQVKPI